MPKPNQKKTNQRRDKLLFCGLSEVGKTAIRDLVFGGKKVIEVEGLSATLNYVRQLVHIDSDRTFIILDLGGQKIFLERFMNQFSTFVFHNVCSLIYVVDCIDRYRLDSSKAYFDSAITYLKQYSPFANIIVLIHKIDLLQNTPDKIQTVQYLRNFFQRDVDSPIIFFETSIYDNSLIDAFNEILRLTFPEMYTSSRPKESRELAPTGVDPTQIESISTIKSSVDPISTSETNQEVPQPSSSLFKISDELKHTKIEKAIGLDEDLSKETTKPELISKEKISPITQPGFGSSTESLYKTFTAAERLIEYLEATVISLELLYGALLEEDGEPLIEIGDSSRYLEIARESYDSFQLKSIKLSESIDPWVVETGDLLIVAQPIKTSRALMLVCVSPIKNQLFEKMPKLSRTIKELVHNALETPI